MARSKVTEEASEQEKLIRQLKAALGGGTEIITDDSVMTGDTFTIPEGMTYERAIAVLERKRDEDESEAVFSRTFNYRPHDGAYATSQVLRERFGIYVGVNTWFERAQLIDVKVSVTETIQVPWGLLAIPGWDNTEVYLAAEKKKDYGQIFKLLTKGPRKYRLPVEDFFDAVGDYLKDHSIYRGKAIVGTAEPDFLDLRTFDPGSVVYSGDVRSVLDSVLWSVVRYTDAMRRDRISRKRAVLLYGPYGAGKTLTGQLTASIAVEHGWTFITARPGRDDLNDTLRTARMYQPAVVFFEDVDGAASVGDDDPLAELLDMFDGITSKGGELVIVMTTNHIERIHKAMLRPGRLDALVRIAELDRGGIEALIKVAAPDGKLDPDVDFDEVYNAVGGFFPAFVVEVVARASAVALARVEGAEEYLLTTTDLVTAALQLGPQLKYMEDALEGIVTPDVETALGALVKQSVEGTKVLDYDDDERYHLSAVANGDDD